MLKPSPLLLLSWQISGAVFEIFGIRVPNVDYLHHVLASFPNCEGIGRSNEVHRAFYTVELLSPTLLARRLQLEFRERVRLASEKHDLRTRVFTTSFAALLNISHAGSCRTFIKSKPRATQHTG